MLIPLPKFYVGLLDGAPAHVGFTRESITLELFRDPDIARQRFEEIACVQILPRIKVISLGPWEYEDLSKKVKLMEQQLADLKELRRAWWITEKTTALMQWIRKNWQKWSKLWRK